MSFYGQDEAASRVEPRIRVFVPHRLCLEVCEGFLHTGRIFEKGLGTGSFFENPDLAAGRNGKWRGSGTETSLQHLSAPTEDCMLIGVTV